MPLSDAKLRAAKPREKAYKLSDGGGLHLYVAPSGVRSWRWRYEQDGREQTATLGRYPEMGLVDARSARDGARLQLRAGGRPGAKVQQSERTFEAVAIEWHTLNAPRWKPQHAANVLQSLRAEVFGVFGAKPIDRVTGADVLEAVRTMEQRGAVETARRVKQRCSSVFGFAIASGWAQIDPTSGLRAALAPLPPKGRRPALTTLKDARKLIAALDACAAQPVVKVASRFLALTAARPGEVAGLRWTELHDLNLDSEPFSRRRENGHQPGSSPEWRLPVERTKVTRERAGLTDQHVIPLIQAAVECLRAIRPLTMGSPFVFPNARSLRAPMSENALGQILQRLGYGERHVPHGWRATFSTVMNERFPADRQAIDLMLAHVPKDRVEAAYNRARHTARRRELAQAWAEMLLEGAVPAGELVVGRRRGNGR